MNRPLEDPGAGHDGTATLAFVMGGIVCGASLSPA